MQLQCDVDDKVQDNMKDTSDLHMEALAFDNMLLTKSVSAKSTEFPKNPPTPPSSDKDDDEEQQWQDMGLEIDINNKKKKLNPD